MALGIVVVGHGKFAEGLTHTIEMIAGKQEDYVSVIFDEGAPFEKLSEDIKRALDSMNEGAIVCCDLLGGSPFKAAYELKVQYENVAVIVGTNVPLLLELCFGRLAHTNALECAQEVVNKAVTSIQVIDSLGERKQEDEGDGI